MYFIITTKPDFTCGCLPRETTDKHFSEKSGYLLLANRGKMDKYINHIELTRARGQSLGSIGKHSPRPLSDRRLRISFQVSWTGPFDWSKIRISTEWPSFATHERWLSTIYEVIDNLIMKTYFSSVWSLRLAFEAIRNQQRKLSTKHSISKLLFTSTNINTM